MATPNHVTALPTLTHELPKRPDLTLAKDRQLMAQSLIDKQAEQIKALNLQAAQQSCLLDEYTKQIDELVAYVTALEARAGIGAAALLAAPADPVAGPAN